MTGKHKCIIALDEAVKSVCPITGVAMGRREDRASWKFRPMPEATPQQMRAAQGVIDAFVDNFVDDVEESADIKVARLEARVLALEAR